MAAGGQAGHPTLRFAVELRDGGAQRAGQKSQRVGPEEIFVGFKIAYGLAGHLRFLSGKAGETGELILGQAEPEAAPADDPHQRHVFRQPVPARHRRPHPNP